MLNFASACSKYVDKPEYVYKSVLLEDYPCLVVLERLSQTRTNESRKAVVDTRYAKFRGDIFMVRAILNMTNSSETFTSIYNGRSGYSPITY